MPPETPKVALSLFFPDVLMSRLIQPPPVIKSSQGAGGGGVVPPPPLWQTQNETLSEFSDTLPFKDQSLPSTITLGATLMLPIDTTLPAKPSPSIEADPTAQYTVEPSQF